LATSLVFAHPEISGRELDGGGGGFGNGVEGYSIEEVIDWAVAVSHAVDSKHRGLETVHHVHRVVRQGLATAHRVDHRVVHLGTGGRAEALPSTWISWAFGATQSATSEVAIAT